MAIVSAPGESIFAAAAAAFSREDVIPQAPHHFSLPVSNKNVMHMCLCMYTSEFCNDCMSFLMKDK